MARHDNWWHWTIGTLILLALVGTSCLQAKDGSDTADSAEEISSMITSIRSSLGVGDFESAWETHVQMYERVLTSHRAHQTFYEICGAVDCPDFGMVSWILGKSRTDVGRILGALESIPDKTLANEWRAYFEAKVLPYVGARSRPIRNPSNQMRMYFLFEESHADLRGHVVGMVDTDSELVWGVIDTGAFKTHVGEGNAGGGADAVRAVRPRSTGIRWDGSEVESGSVSLRSFVFGDVREELLPASATELFKSVPDAVGLGVSLLFRYDAMCFSRQTRVLYLGQLGPCSDARRLAAHGAEIDPFHIVPTVALPLGMHEGAIALIDSGSDTNLCKPWLAKKLAGKAVQFGSQSLLKAHCNPDEAPITESYMFDMVIGMETLGTFAAFGWELNPFRLYFVPNQDSS